MKNEIENIVRRRHHEDDEEESKKEIHIDTISEGPSASDMVKSHTLTVSKDEHLDDQMSSFFFSQAPSSFRSVVQKR